MILGLGPTLAAVNVNSASILLLAVAWLWLGYRWWARLLDRRIVHPRDHVATPAVRLADGRDYHAAPPMVLFGHHFSSIAGAGPIVGPIVALACFGWGPTLLWILLGSVFIGAVHDYTALMVSVQNDGKSVPEIARHAVGEHARVLFLAFVWIALVFVITAFVGATRTTFLKQPEIVFPTFMMMPLAVLFGLAVYRYKVNLALCTAAAFVAMLFLLYVGCHVPITLTTLPQGYASPTGRIWLSIEAGLSPAAADRVWFLVLLGYGFGASVLPVWILLQPRDYIAAWLLFLGLSLGAVGILFSHRAVEAPVFTSVRTREGPLWPMLFIFVACGAISGFHSIVSGGTSSKQLARERDGRAIGFGSMIVEALLGVVTLLVVGAGLRFDGGAETGVTLKGLLGAGSSGPVLAFGHGFGVVTSPLVSPVGKLIGIPGLGTVFGILLVNTFVMTTLDTTVRLSRFIGTELAGPVWRPMRNPFFSAFVACAVAYLLNLSSNFGKIWLIFGSSNQLLAALALIIVTAYYVRRGRPRLYTLLPAVFMVATTIAALGYQFYGYVVVPWLRGEPANLPLGISAIVLLALGLAVVAQAWSSVVRPAPGFGLAQDG